MGLGKASPPIATSMLKLDETIAWGELRFGLPQEADDWMTCSDLIDSSERLAEWRNEAAEMFVELQDCDVEEIAPAVPAAHVLGWYCDTFAWIGSALFHSARRVPDIAPDSVAFRRHPVEGWIDGIALLNGSFLCLPDDPSVDHPDATAVPDVETLAASLRSRVVDHAQQFLGRYEPDVRLGWHSLWGAVTDSFDSGAWTAGSMLGDAAAGARDSRMLLPGNSWPFTSGSSTYEVLDARGRRWWSRRRETCCFAYRLPKPSVCFTCPRIDDAERATRADKWPDPF